MKSPQMTKTLRSPNYRFRAWAILISLSVPWSLALGQCDPTVPSFIVDLTASPAATYLSPVVQRLDHCCGATDPDQCIEFIVTLHPTAQGIVFDICSGATPGGAMFYQLNCGSPTAVGTPLCLNGPGPHIITFCKPGNNNNEYCITSIPAPSAGPDANVNDGCSATLTTTGFAPGTTTWTSISPGTTGAYDAFLSCPTCANTLVTGGTGYPAVVDYLVCGNAVSPCSSTLYCDTVQVYFNPTLTASIMPLQPTICFGATSTTITAMGGGGSPPYSFLWNNGATSAMIPAGLGNYSVDIGDATNCPPTSATVTVTEFQQPIQAFAGVDITVCGGGAAQLNAAVTGASGGIWTAGTGQFQPSTTALNAIYTPSPVELVAGSVTLVLETTGNGTCPGDQDTLVVNFGPPFPSMSVAATEATCQGSTDGTAAVTPVIAGYTYLWSDPGAQTSPTATGLGASAYSVTITDQAGCMTTVNTFVSEPLAITITNVAITDETCAGNGDGSVSVSASGGTSPYSYVWSNGSTTPSIAVGAGTYMVGVSDANGCTPAMATATVVATAQPNIAAAGADQIVCLNDYPISLNGSVQNATSGVWSGGSGTFSGSGLNVAYTPSATETALGGIDLTLTTTGNSACPAGTDVVHISLPNTFVNASVSHTDALCAGSSSGTATFAPALPTLTYLWSPGGQTTATAINLPSGTHTVTVTDTNGCDTTMSVIVAQPSALAIGSVQVTNETCAGMGNGSATVSVNGGTPPYQYIWNTGATTASITGGNGTYTVSVTDANGCAPITASATILATAQPNAAQAGADQIVCMNDYPITLNGSVQNATGGIWSGGTGAFSGSGWNMSYTPSTTDIALGSADLTLTTTGNNACPSASDVVHIALPNTFLNATLYHTNVLCSGGNSGTATFTPSLPSLTYQWTPSGQTTATAINLSSGTHLVTVSDTYGCDTTMSVSIAQPPPLVITNVQTSNPSCAGSSNGSATATPLGGTPGYSYQWSANAAAQTTATASNLISGIYIVTVMDANGCTAQGLATLTAPPPLQLAAQVPDTVCVNAPVQLTAQASGGDGNLLINWAGIGSGTSLVYSFPTSQNVVVTVTDGAGCPGPTLTLPVQVLDLSTAALVTDGDSTVCPGGIASVSAQVVGYAGSVSYQWSELQVDGPGPHAVPVDNTQTLHVSATNSCGQVLTGAVLLTLETPPLITLPPFIAEGCAPLTVQFPDSLTDQTVTWLWDLGDGNTSTAMAPLHTYASGTYVISLTVTTSAGCSAQAHNTSSVIAFAPPVAGFTASTYSSDMNYPTVSFTDNSAGSINDYAWDFGDGGTSNTDSPTHNYGDVGEFTVELTVTDVNGCTDLAVATIQMRPIYNIEIPNAFTPDPNGGGGGYYDPTDLGNDIFYPFVDYLKDFRMRIWNRWGELVFESDEIAKGWDGWYKGHLSQQDVYVYQCWFRFVDGFETDRTGDLTLLR